MMLALFPYQKVRVTIIVSPRSYILWVCGFKLLAAWQIVNKLCVRDKIEIPLIISFQSFALARKKLILLNKC